MTSPEAVLAAITLAAIGLATFTYAGYPVLIWVFARVFGRPPIRPDVPDDELPTVTLVIAAHNEDAHIRKRIENALACHYPAGKFRVVIASDCSTDDTNAIVAEYARHGVELLAFDDRRGKTTVLNDVLPRIKSDVIMLSDANTFTDPDATRNLAAWFTDPTIGVVCGRLVLTDPIAGRNVDGIYWKYETFLKKCESRLGALLGSNGGIYAIRRSMYTPVPNDTLVDDFVIPLMARERTGCQIVYDRDAVAVEETPDNMVSEFHRRVRIGAGGFQSLGILRNLLNPKHGWMAFTFLCHKVFRWTCPLFLIVALLANVGMAAVAAQHVKSLAFSISMAGLAAQLGFYALAMLGGSLPARPRFLRVLRLPAMFTMMNAALAVGFVRWMRGQQSAAWKRTERKPLSPETMEISLEGTSQMSVPVELRKRRPVRHRTKTKK